jgi:hypothetical protein
MLLFGASSITAPGTANAAGFVPQIEVGTSAAYLQEVGFKKHRKFKRHHHFVGHCKTRYKTVWYKTRHGFKKARIKVGRICY